MPLPMPSFSLNPLPDRNKLLPTEPTAANDNLAAVKAAAWAWYQHGSGSESKPMREFGLTRPTTLCPKPSRYRLEATAARTRSSIQDNSQTPDTHTSLLDSYELASISSRLSDLLHPSDPINLGLTSFESEILDLGRRIEATQTPTKPNKLFRGFWRRPSVMCGKMEDVVLATLIRPPDKQPRRPSGRWNSAARG